MPQISTAGIEIKSSQEEYAPGMEPKGLSRTIAAWADPVAQVKEGDGQMPQVSGFDGLFYPDWGAGYPPDPVGDVGAKYYIQAVNISIGIYDKATRYPAARVKFNDFFEGTGTSCDSYNGGDPVVVYDRFTHRWLISDFVYGVPLNYFTSYYQCIAVSKSEDPVAGGWWLYAVPIISSNGFQDSFNDYPKFGVWPDAYYLSTNMFQNASNWNGVWVWALNKAKMLQGQAFTPVHFELSANSGYSCLLPAHALTAPPAGSPEYFVSVTPLNKLQVWKFHVDWANTANSTFTGPTQLTVADFAIAASVPQADVSHALDSLSYRLMMQLQYRSINGVEALWVSHTVASHGVGGVRWYEVRLQNGSPSLYQQGTYQPDMLHRWMPSIAVDRDGNMAAGYSVSSSEMHPSIRYAGRLAGETPGLLTQPEGIIKDGSGSQSSSNRWGDYTAMSVDPVDDCTFWYTNEYYTENGNSWLTWIAYFKYPSCGQAKGTLRGVVRNAANNVPISGVQVVAKSPAVTFHATTDNNGGYSMSLVSGSYNITAGPLSPGFPISTTLVSQPITAGMTTIRDLQLVPQPDFTNSQFTLNDHVPYGNGNGYPEPGEQGLLLLITLTNDGSAVATHVSAHLDSLTQGVSIEQADSGYPDILPASSGTNQKAYVFSVSNNIPCGSDAKFRLSIHSNEGSWSVNLNLNISTLLPRTDIFSDTMEGANNWTTGGIANHWGLVTNDYYSPMHAWQDSPGASYDSNADNYLQSRSFNLQGKRKTILSARVHYALEPGYDFVYLEYSLDGGVTWNNAPLASFNGLQNEWKQVRIEAPQIDNQPNVAIRFHLISDGGVQMDGISIDDVEVSYEPYLCSYTGPYLDAPTAFTPFNNSYKTNPVTFRWFNGDKEKTPDRYVISLDGRPAITTTSSVTGTSMILTVGQHRWSVAAYKGDILSPSSPEWTFKVVSPAPGIAPLPPSLLWPLDGASVRGPSIPFHWTYAGQGGTATSYALKLDETRVMTFTTAVEDILLPLSPGKHIWSVQTVNAAGKSTYSSPWTVNVYLVWKFFLTDVFRNALPTSFPDPILMTYFPLIQ
ncbi:MAG: carboxypeptidase regulatory-like domain-containing protein [Omnitrophica WOR_2 bacterium]